MHSSAASGGGRTSEPDKDPSVNKLSTTDNPSGAASSCISLQRKEEQTALSGLQSRKKYIVFSPEKFVYL